jgi:DNA polymerase iota
MAYSSSPYYEDLSGDDDNESSSSESSRASSESSDYHDDRIILHADVDCFYCQCECIDQNIPPDRPFAIRQKHIVVTCNYAARQQYGISKLMSLQEAVRRCPSLLLLDGSDLERYRKHARNIYQSFRRACQKVQASLPVCRGSMDEMMADLTQMSFDSDDDDITSDIYVHGEHASTVVLTEDQSGAQARVVDTRSSSCHVVLSENDKRTRQRLLRAAVWASHQIRETILRETGFTTTLGLSVNPSLAKLASGLRKPATVNVLYPWRAQELLHAMPLRKIPGVGSSTSKILEPCLATNQHRGTKPPAFWTCR